MRFAPGISALLARVALLAVTLLAVTLTLPLAQAEELTAPAAPTHSAIDHPSRGMSMDKVEAAYGAPANRVPAVGHPPITRWEYPAFVVYFENRTVLHTVIKG